MYSYYFISLSVSGEFEVKTGFLVISRVLCLYGYESIHVEIFHVSRRNANSLAMNKSSDLLIMWFIWLIVQFILIQFCT